jgi:hypothetical protein
VNFNLATARVATAKIKSADISAIAGPGRSFPEHQIE